MKNTTLALIAALRDRREDWVRDFRRHAIQMPGALIQAEQAAIGKRAEWLASLPRAMRARLARSYIREAGAAQ